MKTANTTQVVQILPQWIRIVSILFAVLGFLVGLTLLFSPASALKTVDMHAKGARYLTQMWATRQFALAFIFAYAIIKKSGSMLSVAYLFFLVMNIGDFIVGISQKNSSLYIGAIVMCIVSTTMLYIIKNTDKLIWPQN